MTSCKMFYVPFSSNDDYSEFSLIQFSELSVRTKSSVMHASYDYDKPIYRDVLYWYLVTHLEQSLLCDTFLGLSSDKH